MDGADASTVTASGGSVSEWRDKTSGARHFTASSTAQPTYTATLNGRNVLTFNGSTNTMTGNAAAQDAIRNRAGYTFFAVSKVGSVAAGERLLCGFGTTVIFRAGQNGSSPYAGGRRVSGDTLENITGAASSLAVGSSYITSAIVNHTAQSLTGNLNGSGFASDTTYMAAGSSENTAMTASLGSQSSAYGFYNGDIAEVIIFDTALSTTDRARVESYLAAKWGISGVHAPATATNDPVGAWLDKSGNNRHATSSTASQRPTLSATTQNSRRLLSLDGSDDRFSIAFPVTQNDPVSLFVVARRGSGTWGGGGAGGYGSFLNGSGGTSSGPQLRVDTGNIELIGGSNRSSVVGSNVGVSACSIISGTVTNRDTALYIEGALVDSDAGAGTISSSGTRTAIGDWNPATGGGGPLQAFLAEMLVYRSALTAAERQCVERYLAFKWGITLAPQVSNAEAQDWINRVYANGGTVSATTATAVNTFCDSIDAVSGLRACFYRLNLFCGTGLSAALVPLYRGQSRTGTQFGNTTDTNNAFAGVGTDYAETGATGGLLGNGTTKYLNTTLAPSDLPSYTSAHVAVYHSQPSGTSQTRAWIGCRDTANASQIYLSNGMFSTSAVFGQYMSTATANFNTGGSQTGAAGGFRVLSRTAADRLDNYYNAVSQANSTANITGGIAGVTSTRPFFIFANNNQGTADQVMNGRIMGYSLGLGLSQPQVDAYNAAMLAFQTSLTRNV